MVIGVISHPDCLLHEMGPLHPEQPDRLRVIQKEIKKSGLGAETKEYLAVPALKEDLLRVHTAEYVERIFAAAPKHGLVALDPDTWMNPHTLNAALLAAGSVKQAVDLVMSGEVGAVFCNIRPPGHHAESNQAMGFCFFNNIAVGVAYALEHYHLKRIAIVDFDVHHGNGTENIFRKEARVLFCSSFQHPFYPYSGAATANPHIINIPLAAGCSGKEFREEVTRHWLPALKDFQPEMIFFSAGFDAHAKEDLANLSLHEEDYAWITREVKQIADTFCRGRIVSVLEGGYALNVLGKCVVAHLMAL
jgi:acetoin utilization deacetylase AcuC-like enzyme